MARSLELVGDGWSLLILRDALLGASRFQDFQEQLGTPPNTLARRLTWLVDKGLLTRRCYERHPPRFSYELTPMALELLPVLLALSAWGNRWLFPKGAALECADPLTGALIEPVVVDKHTLRPLLPGKVALRTGRGASGRLRQRLRRPIVFGAPARAEQRGES